MKASPVEDQQLQQKDKRRKKKEQKNTQNKIQILICAHAQAKMT